MSFISYFRALPQRVAMIFVIIVTMVGLWLFITPFYNWVVKEFEITPMASVIIGVVIVFIATRMWKMRPW